MIRETDYERGWSTCLRCGTRRPALRLTDGACNDGWCEQFEAERRAEAEVAAARARHAGETLELPFGDERSTRRIAEDLTADPEDG